MLCINCKEEIAEGSLYCSKCGAAQTSAVSPKSRLCAMLLGIFLGFLGIHNFYLKRTVRGVIQCVLSFLPFFFMAAIAIIFFGAEAGGHPLLSAASSYIDNSETSILAIVIPPMYLICLIGTRIWSLVEWIVIAAGSAKDGDGLPVKNWTRD